jgi:hypothetical protein
MRKVLVVLILASIVVLALSVPATAAPEPRHTYPGNVVYFTQELKGPAPVLDPDFGLMFNQLGRDVIPINKAFAVDFGFKSYGGLVAVLAQQDK